MLSCPERQTSPKDEQKLQKTCFEKTFDCKVIYRVRHRSKTPRVDRTEVPSEKYIQIKVLRFWGKYLFTLL